MYRPAGRRPIEHGTRGGRSAKSLVSVDRRTADRRAPSVQYTSYRPPWALPLIDLMLGVGDLVNVSSMLRSIKRLAESGSPIA